MSKLDALNRAFEKAFAHTAAKETLTDLLDCLGEELECDRISIFEARSDETVDNTHEWCRTGAAEERDFLQNLPAESFDSWRDRLKKDEILKIRDLEEIAADDPDVYSLFHPQHVSSAIVSKLAFHGRDLGFFILENPCPEVFADADLILPGMRYILSSLVYSDLLVHRLEKIGYTDSLTGTGNRASLQNRLESLDPAASLGVFYCEVLGFESGTDARMRIRESGQELLRIGNILVSVFDESCVFRVGADEFLVISEGCSEREFSEKRGICAGLFREEQLLTAAGGVWKEEDAGLHDSMIRRAHLAVYDEKRKLLKDREDAGLQREGGEWTIEDFANVDLYRGDEFFRKAEQFLGQIFDEHVLTGVIDINYFKLYNDIFGRAAGNLLLENVAAELQKKVRTHHGIAGYMGGDNFCFVIPVRNVSGREELCASIEEALSQLEYTDGFSPALGFYLSEDRQETVIAMYDRAQAALAEIQGDYFDHYRFYDAAHFQHARDEQLLIMDVREGLPKGEFTFYLQPQVHDRTGLIIGAEALVRWESGGQLIPPSRFVPALERSGYIFAVDCFVWESVVSWIRSLLDRGIQPVPISVNVSRVDFYFTDIAGHFISLLDRYRVEHRFVGVEITESALTDNAESILEAVRKLHEAGFRVLMDDFGSGTSSLSMLHTMHLDVLKTDVKFMSRSDSDKRAISIVEAVISMAHMIGMLVVTEGVETENQKDNLIRLGDNYAQGFYFYRPMPVPEFEKLLADPEKIGEPPLNGDTRIQSHLHLKEIIREGMVSETLLDSIIGPAAVYRETAGGIELIQINDRYSELTGIGTDDRETMSRFVEHSHGGSREKVASVLHRANTHPFDGAESVIDFTRADGSTVNLAVRVFMLYSCEDHKLYLSTLHEI